MRTCQKEMGLEGQVEHQVSAMLYLKIYIYTFLKNILKHRSINIYT